MPQFPYPVAYMMSTNLERMAPGVPLGKGRSNRACARATPGKDSPSVSIFIRWMCRQSSSAPVVVGLAIARELALAGREVLVLEAESNFGQGISSRNSEVIPLGHLLHARVAKGFACGVPGASASTRTVPNGASLIGSSAS